MITPMVDSADFMASEPDGQLDMLAAGDFMAMEERAPILTNATTTTAVSTASAVAAVPATSAAAGRAPKTLLEMAMHAPAAVDVPADTQPTAAAAVATGAAAVRSPEPTPSGVPAAAIRSLDVASSAPAPATAAPATVSPSVAHVPVPASAATTIPSSPGAAGPVPVATRNGTSAPKQKVRRGRRSKAAASLVGRRPEEWVLDPGDFTQLPDRPYQELWFELRTWTWKSLAVVPTVPGGSELDVAEKLVVVGVSNSNRRMSLISAEGASVADTDRVIAMIRAAEARGDRVIVCTDSIHDNPAAAPIIRAVNGAVLSVRLGTTEKAAVERTIATIHRNRIIGVITRPSR